ncbi:MAG: TIGR03936 family radical SAM-associated protein [Candidatus Omnitrophica bacterium]|nr:TIGR03936 family radical SAM-associated protein [Candidatus Omnitrophota bacterium]
MQAITIEAQFEKNKDMRYISHLDFIRLIHRALRRADLPFALTEGFSPHPKIQFGQALKVGVEGEVTVKFFLREPVTCEEFKRRIEQQLTEGIRLSTLHYGN